MGRGFVAPIISLGLAACSSAPPAPSQAAAPSATSSSREVVVSTGTARVFVLELSLPSGVTLLDAKKADDDAKKRAAALLALEVTQKKIALGLIETPVWSRTNELTLSEKGYEDLLKRGGRLAPGSKLKREVTRGFEGEKTVEDVSYTGTFESPSDARYEKVGRPRSEAAAYWKPMLDEQRATLAALPPEPATKPATTWEVRERWRYIAYDPPPPSLEDAGLVTATPEGYCAACLNEATKHGAIFLRSLGAPGVDLNKVPPAQLASGFVVPDSKIVVESLTTSDKKVVERPHAGRLVLRQEKSCPARIVRVEDTLVVSMGSGVIAVPERADRFWHELRDASCATVSGNEFEVFGPAPPPIPAGEVRNDPMDFWVSQYKAELDRLEQKKFKLPPP